MRPEAHRSTASAWRKATLYQLFIIMALAFNVGGQCKRVNDLEARNATLQSALDRSHDELERDQLAHDGYDRILHEASADLSQCRRDMASDMQLFAQYQRVDDSFHQKFCAGWGTGKTTRKLQFAPTSVRWFDLNVPDGDLKDVR